MRPPCEVVVKDILPVIRALLAKELIERHKLSQMEVAVRLGITQPAVSQYLSMVRGKKGRSILVKKIQEHVRGMAEDIARGQLTQAQIIERYCGICRSVDMRELICLLHMRAAHRLRAEKCRICFP